MLKFCGGVMILAGSLGLGLWYRQQMYERAFVLGQLERILELFISGVRYEKAALPECCLKISGEMPEPYAGSLRQICEEIGRDGGAPVREALQSGLEGMLRELPVTEQDRKEFLAFLPRQGYADEQMQLTAMEQCLKRIGGIRAALEEENGKRGRLAVGMGMFGGALLIVVLL